MKRSAETNTCGVNPDVFTTNLRRLTAPVLQLARTASAAARASAAGEGRDATSCFIRPRRRTSIFFQKYKKVNFLQKMKKKKEKIKEKSNSPESHKSRAPRARRVTFSLLKNPLYLPQQQQLLKAAHVNENTL